MDVYWTRGKTKFRCSASPLPDETYSTGHPMLFWRRYVSWYRPTEAETEQQSHRNTIRPTIEHSGMEYTTYLSFSRRYHDWYPSWKYPWTQIVHGVWRCVWSAALNAIHPQLGQPTHCISTHIFFQKGHLWCGFVGSFKSNIHATHYIRYKTTSSSVQIMNTF